MSKVGILATRKVKSKKIDYTKRLQLRSKLVLNLAVLKSYSALNRKNVIARFLLQ